MIANAAWSATRNLRSWERVHLRLATGQRLPDVGCGLADVARALAEELGATGEIVGIDASKTMLEAARSSWDAACPAHFEIGDAQALGVHDAARQGRFTMSLTMYAVAAARP
jgi:ubiquinone/menaquinone biosynthesis C-methylase UbiE